MSNAALTIFADFTDQLGDISATYGWGDAFTMWWSAHLLVQAVDPLAEFSDYHGVWRLMDIGDARASGLIQGVMLAQTILAGDFADVYEDEGADVFGYVRSKCQIATDDRWDETTWALFALGATLANVGGDEYALMCEMLATRLGSFFKAYVG